VKRIVATAALAAVLALPAGPAAAVDGPPAGIRSCGPMQFGFVVWVMNPKTGESMDVFEYCQPIGPPPTTAH
jgi:hypothetical protein